MTVGPSGDGSSGAPHDEQPRPILDFTADMIADSRGDDRVDFERGMSYLAPATLVTIALCTVVFGWQLSTGALDSQDALIDSGALVTDRLVRGEVWRLVSSMFLHGGPEHLVGNMLALFILGIACEHAFGTAGMLGMYAVAGIVGGVASAAVEPLPTVGASGAIFGLMGCTVAMLARRRNELHVRDGRIGVVLAAWTAWQLMLGFMNPMIATMAHLGGLVAGAVLGWSIVPQVLRRREVETWPGAAAQGVTGFPEAVDGPDGNQNRR